MSMMQHHAKLRVKFYKHLLLRTFIVIIQSVVKPDFKYVHPFTNNKKNKTYTKFLGLPLNQNQTTLVLKKSNLPRPVPNLACSQAGR